MAITLTAKTVALPFSSLLSFCLFWYLSCVFFQELGVGGGVMIGVQNQSFFYSKGVVETKLSYVDYQLLGAGELPISDCCCV